MKRANKLLRNVPSLRPLADDELSAVSGAKGEPTVSEIVVTKRTDTASPSLFKACCTGRHFDAATLVL